MTKNSAIPRGPAQARSDTGERPIEATPRSKAHTSEARAKHGYRIKATELPPAVWAIAGDLGKLRAWLEGASEEELIPLARNADVVLAQLESLKNQGAASPPTGAQPAGNDGASVRTDALTLLSSGAFTRSVRAWMRQIVDSTRRAELAEARVKTLEAQLDAHTESVAALGRRFGRGPHESFEAFVVRLGMTARAAPLSRATASRPVPLDGPGELQRGSG